MHVVHLHVEGGSIICDDLVDHLVVGLYARRLGELPLEGRTRWAALDLHDDASELYVGREVVLDPGDRLHIVKRLDHFGNKRSKEHGETPLVWGRYVPSRCRLLYNLKSIAL